MEGCRPAVEGEPTVERAAGLVAGAGLRRCRPRGGASFNGTDEGVEAFVEKGAGLARRAAEVDVLESAQEGRQLRVGEEDGDEEAFLGHHLFDRAAASLLTHGASA